MVNEKSCSEYYQYINSVSKRKWQRHEMAILQVFPVIFLPTTLAFTKLRFWKSFWRAKHVTILIGSKAIQKTQFVSLPSVFNFVRKVFGNIQLLNGHFWPFFGNYIKIFQKIEIQTVILSCLVSQNLNWIKSHNMYLYFIP